MSNISKLSKKIDKKIVKIETINNNHIKISGEWVSYFYNNWEDLFIDWVFEIKSKNLIKIKNKISTKVTDIICWRNNSYLIICKIIESEWKSIINHINLILSVEHNINSNILNRVSKLRDKKNLNYEEKDELEKLEQELSADNIEIKEKYLLQRNRLNALEWEVTLF